MDKQREEKTMGEALALIGFVAMIAAGVYGILWLFGFWAINY